MIKRIDQNVIELNGGLRLHRPEKGGRVDYYGYQECEELINERWEGFVSIAQNKKSFEKRVSEFVEFEREIANSVMKRKK